MERKTWLYAGISEVCNGTCDIITSENPIAADNQQERLEMKEEEPNPNNETFSREYVLGVFRKHKGWYEKELERWEEVLEELGHDRDHNKEFYDMAMDQSLKTHRDITVLKSIADDLGLREELFRQPTEDK